MKLWKKSVSVLLAALVILTVVTAGAVPGTVKADAASWNGYNYGGGTLYGYQTFLQAFGIDYDTYIKWMDDHDADSANPRYYLGTPYVEWDHRNPHGDCQGAYGAEDIPGVEGMNCTGFVWHVLYKSAVMSGASSEQISRLRVMWEVPYTWANYGVYRIYFSSIEEAYESGVLERGDLMWIYGSKDNHNAIFYGKNAKDFIYWDSAGVRNRYSTVHAIGDCLGLWVAKVTQPNYIQLQIDTAQGGDGVKFGTKYCIFNNKNAAQAALDHPQDSSVWNTRIGTIVLDQNGRGTYRKETAPSAVELWSGNTPRTTLPYFSSEPRLVGSSSTYYAVQWSAAPGMTPDTAIREFKDSGKRTSTGYRIYSFTSPIKVDTPEISALKSVADGVKVSWNKISGAEKYRVYVKNSSGGWTRVGETAATSFIDTAALSGSEYTYTVRCADNGGNFISDFDRVGKTHTYIRLDTPVISSMTSSAEGVTLKWDPVSGAERYRVYVQNSKGAWTRLTDTSGTEYLHETVTNGTTYVYTVRCADTQGDFTSDFDRVGKKHTHKGVGTPVINAPISETEGVRLTWQEVDGAYKYRVYKQNSSGGWTFIGDTADTEYFDYAVNSGSAYTYTVRCVNQANYFSSDFDRKGKSVTYKGIATPVLLSAENEPEGIRVTWQPSEGAVTYRVYRKAQGGSWTKIGETADASYFDNTVAFGGAYAYTVRCINSKKSGFMSYFDTVGKSCTYKGIATPLLNTIVSEPEGVRLRWTPAEGAFTYRVYYQAANGAWTRLGDTSGGEFFDTTVPLNGSRVYTVRAISSNRFISDFNRSGWRATYTGVGTPQINALESTEQGVRITWDAVDGADRYRVFRMENGTWKGLGNTAETSFTDTNVTPGNIYVYTLRCIADRGYISGYDNNGSRIEYQPAEEIADAE